MCGIFAVFNIQGSYTRVKGIVIKMLRRIIHRGPDATGLTHYEDGENIHHFICHQRLSIVDPFLGDQPFFTGLDQICGVANGEIYNHIEVSFFSIKTFVCFLFPIEIFLFKANI